MLFASGRASVNGSAIDNEDDDDDDDDTTWMNNSSILILVYWNEFKRDEKFERSKTQREKEIVKQVP